MTRHADRPLCPMCGEDRPSMIATDERAHHCNVCGKTWPVVTVVATKDPPR